MVNKNNKNISLRSVRMRNSGSSNGGGSSGRKPSFNSASVVTLSTSTVEKWNPTSYSIGRTGFNISNQNPQGYMILKQ